MIVADGLHACWLRCSPLLGRLGRSVKDGDGKGLVSAAVEYGSAQDPGPGLAASKTQGEVQRSRGPEVQLNGGSIQINYSARLALIVALRILCKFGTAPGRVEASPVRSSTSLFEVTVALVGCTILYCTARVTRRNSSVEPVRPSR